MSKFCMGCMEQYDDNKNMCPYCGYMEGTTTDQALHMEPGSVLYERYIVGTSLGYGGFGVTYIAWDALLEQKVAIKEYLPSEFSTRMAGTTTITVYSGEKNKQFYDGLARFLDEARRLAKLQDVEGIVRIYDCFEENNTAYIIMEYLEGETLAGLLKDSKRYSPEEAVEMLLPVVDSMSKVHEHGIIHRDIAPDNIFVTKSGAMKVIDFGAARYATTSHSRSLTVIIKPGYSPEEQYRSNGDQGPASDVYALAATLYKMITGHTPPDALERRAYYENKKKDILKEVAVYCPDIDRNTENAILNAMNVRVEDRTPTMEAFRQELTSTEPVARVAGKMRKLELLRWPLWAKIVIPTAAVIIGVFGVLFATGVIQFTPAVHSSIVVPEGMTRVPSVVNHTAEEAQERLETAMLTYMVTGKEYSKEIPADLILQQDVAAGSVVAQQTTVQVTISGGVQMIKLPNMVNMRVTESSQALEKLGFVVRTERQYSSAVAKDYVISQSLSGNTEYPVGTEVKLVVSAGKDPSSQGQETTVIIPYFTGRSYEDAVEEAARVGVTLAIVSREYSDTYEEDLIISQSLEGGSSGKSGDVVELVVSLGAPLVTVPDCQYRSEADARMLLEAEGLYASVRYAYSSTVAKGLVISQSPGAREEVRQGSAVRVTISQGNATVSGISVNTKPTKTVYNIGEMLDPSGLTLTVRYADGSSKVISSGFTVSPSGTPLNTKGSMTITVQYEGKSVAFSVSVEGVAVKGISIRKMPTTTEYHVGDTLKTSGMSLTATYSDGSTKTITTGFTCSPTTLTTVGSQTITVTYGGVNTSFSVNCKAAAITGTCGNNVTWTLDGTVLTISGKGKMSDYESTNALPWAKYRTQITEIVIQSGVTYVHNQVIWNVPQLKKLSVSETVAIIGDNGDNTSFGSMCPRLSQITVSKNNPYFVSVDNILYTADKKTLILYPRNTSAKSFVVPDTVEIVQSYAFAGTSIEHITVSKNVRVFGWVPRQENLKEITVVSENTSFKSVNGVLFSKDMKDLYYYPPRKEGDYYEIPSGVTRIFGLAFYDNDHLRTIKIPSTVTEIGRESLSFCERLQNVEIPSSVTTIEYGAFDSTFGIKSITIPESVVSMGHSVFYSWKSDQTVYIEGRTAKPATWDAEWAKGSNAKIVWKGEASNASRNTSKKANVKNAYVKESWNSGIAFGLNEQGNPVDWVLYVEFDEMVFDPEIKCSWSAYRPIDVEAKTFEEEDGGFEAYLIILAYISDNKSLIDDYGWLAAKAGVTTYMAGIETVTNEGISRIRVHLPDDPSIAGDQYVEINGQKITFTLTYNGDYESGTGWSASNIRYS